MGYLLERLLDYALLAIAGHILYGHFGGELTFAIFCIVFVLYSPAKE